MLPAFALARPTTVAEVVELLSEERIPYCGGTELLLAMKMGLLRPEALIDLKRVDELRGVTGQDDRVVIGSITSHLDVAADPIVRASLPLLVEIEQKVGNARVRTQGSIGGNLCFAEPRSDVATALTALGATVTLASSSGRREVAMEDFLQGPYWADRGPDELLVSVTVPSQDGRRGVYLKYQTTERPTVGVALLERGEGFGYRLVVGAVGEVPLAFDYARFEDIEPEDVASQAEPVADMTGSDRYKRHVAAVYIRRAVAELRAQEAEGGYR